MIERTDFEHIIKQNILNEVLLLEKKRVEISEQQKNLTQQKELLEKAWGERKKGMPSLANAFADAEYAALKKYQEELFNAPASAKKVEKILKDFHTTRRNEKFYKNIIDFYESIYPHLQELRTEEDDEEDNSDNLSFSEEQRQDPSHLYLTPEEYKKLNPLERNQLALDRYFNPKRRKSKSAIGKEYERYCGYLYERNGYDVYFKGIQESFEDRGIDLVCKKENEIFLIQCKCWSEFKTIYEKYIYQFYGTCTQYEWDLPKKNERPKIHKVFYTTTELSDFAKYIAKRLKIEIVNEKMPRIYPAIKCNISREGEKIYHLPFDQSYDKIKIEEHKGEFYAITCQEAEDKGFRRAFKYNPDKK